MEAAQGSIKVIADAKTDRILGVHMCGPYVSELLAEVVLGLEFAATCEDVALTMNGHQTMSEKLHEAVLSVGRLEERRVGKECGRSGRAGTSSVHKKKKK